MSVTRLLGRFRTLGLMHSRSITACLLLVFSFTSIASAQLFQLRRQVQGEPKVVPFRQGAQPRQFSNRPIGNQLRRHSQSAGNLQQPTSNGQQRSEFRQRQEARRILAQKRQREMEQKGQSKTLYPRLVGEFERQQAILLSVGDWKPHHFPILKEIVAKTEGHARLVILYNQPHQLSQAVSVLSESGKRYSHVDFLPLDLNTVWLRDFGPRFAENENGKAMAIDFYYEGSRPKDDDMPETWSKLTDAEYNHVPWTLQGGNLLTNGKGLAIASNRVFADNRIQFPPTPGLDPVVEQQKFVIRQFKLFCNIKELVLLQPLESEATKHVDMFATFLASDLVLLAQVDGRYDPRNAQILDANAKKLSQLKVDGKPMRVERIYIPPRQEKYWSPYTNIILTERLVLIPTFDSDPPAYVRRAVETYQRLLPEHHVATIDMSSMSRLEGSLHCLSCNIPEFASMPDGLISFADAQSMKGQAVATTPQRSTEQPVAENAANIARKNEYDSSVRKARSAVATYRRNYQLTFGREGIDGYAVAVDDQKLTLLRESDNSQVEVQLNALAQQDRDWATQHRDQINKNGERIKEFLIRFAK